MFPEAQWVAQYQTTHYARQACQGQRPAYTFREYQFYLEIYNTHMDINRAAVAFLKKLFPSGLVGLEVGYN